MCVCMCVYIFLSCWSLNYPHCVSALVWWPWRCTTQQSLEENLLGRRELVGSLPVLHLQPDCVYAKVMTDSAGVQSLTIPVLLGTALMGSLCALGHLPQSGRDISRGALLSQASLTQSSFLPLSSRCHMCIVV